MSVGDLLFTIKLLHIFRSNYNLAACPSLLSGGNIIEIASGKYISFASRG